MLFLRAGWAPLAVFALHGVFSHIILVYRSYRWSDVPMHFTGGVAIAFFFWTCFRAIPEKAISKAARPYLELLFVFTLTAAAGVFWEFGEYVTDAAFGTRALGNVHDTLQDLALGLTGAAAFILIVLLLGKAGRVRPVESGHKL